MLFEKIDSVLLLNYHFYWKNPLVNKYINTKENLVPSEEFEGMLLLRKTKKPLWLSHPFNYAQAKKQLIGVEVKKYSDRKELQKILKKEAGKKIGYDGKFTTVASFERIQKLLMEKKLIDVSKELEAEREIKTPEEVKKISFAVKATEKALQKTITELKTGVSEKKTAEKIETLFKQYGCEKSFCIVAFGENTSHIHHANTNKELKKEVPVLIDCGAKYRGYVADISKSFWFGKKAPSDYKNAHKKVLTCLTNIEAKLKGEINVNELWKETTILEKKLPHALGHGIGLEEHDVPAGIGEKCRWILKSGTVMAFEPAIYTTKFGIRIENDYLVTKKSGKKL